MESSDKYGKYREDYSETEFWGKLRKIVGKVGVKLLYIALLLYYAMKNPATSAGDRAKIIGALGYFILPVDLLPDFIPMAGYTDDLAALTWALYSVSKNITPEVKIQAREKLAEWFPDFDGTSNQ